MSTAFEIVQWILILALLIGRARSQLHYEDIERRLKNIEGSIRDGIIEMLRH